MARILILAASTLIFTSSTLAQCPALPQCECTSWSQTVKCENVGSSLSTILPSIPSITKSLSLSGVSLYSLREQDFDQLPRNNIDELQITNSQIQEISDFAFRSFLSLRKLSLNRNHISSISNQAFGGVGNLQTLDLSRNNLATLANTEVFKSIIYLQELDLSHNQLSDIPNGLFDSQRSLQVLRLDGNEINALKGSAFQGATSLRKLHVSDCGLRTVDEEFFTKATMIDTLDLSYNTLSDIPGNGKLNLLRQLRNLTLHGNSISEIPAAAFQGLNLDVLDLSQNGISNLQSNTFMYLGSVRYLDLSSNRIARLPEYVFQPISSQLYSLKLNNNRGLNLLPKNLLSSMQMLQELNLSFCSLVDLPEALFANVFSLQRVDVSNNRLTFLPQSFLSKANQMGNVRLSNNPWVCDCYIKPLRDWLRFPQSADVLYCTDNAPAGYDRNCASQKCTSPQILLYRDIYTLQDQEIPTCENLGESTSGSMEIIIGVVAGVVVSVIILVIIIVFLCRRHKKGEPLLCGSSKKKSHHKKKRKKDPVNEYYREKKEKRQLDPEIGSLDESDKGFVVRNYFHSMESEDNDDREVDPSMGSQSMTRRGSQESLSHSGYAYGSQAGSRKSSQYSLNSGYRIESAV